MNKCFYNYVSQNSPTFESSKLLAYNALIIKGLLKNYGASVGIESHNTIWASLGMKI
jgi:hypothetical protein